MSLAGCLSIGADAFANSNRERKWNPWQRTRSTSIWKVNNRPGVLAAYSKRAMLCNSRSNLEARRREHDLPEIKRF